jgi:hypothetical protein
MSANTSSVNLEINGEPEKFLGTPFKANFDWNLVFYPYIHR